jgi:hypothetical protein
MLSVIYGECHKQTDYAECHYAECRGAEIKGHIHNTLFYSSPQMGPIFNVFYAMEKCTLRNVNNYLNTNIYSFLETSGGRSSNLYLKLVHFFNTSVN